MASSTRENLTRAPRAVVADLRAEATPKSVTLIAFAVAGFFAGAVVVYYGLWGWDETTEKFTDSPTFRLWAFLIGLQAASWAVGSVFVYRTLRFLWDYRRGRGREILGSLGLLLLLMVLFSIAARNAGAEFPLPHRGVRLSILTALAFVVAAGAAVGMWLVHGALEERFGKDSAERSDDVQEFARLLDRLQLLLTIQGAILAGAILGAGALRNAIVSNEGVSPQSYILLYGVFLTGLVALAYAPTYARARTLGRDLRDRSLPPAPEKGAAGWSSWLSERRALDELLGINAGTAASLRTGLVILAPLSASLVGLLLGSK